MAFPRWRAGTSSEIITDDKFIPKIPDKIRNPTNHVVLKEKFDPITAAEETRVKISTKGFRPYRSARNRGIIANKAPIPVIPKIIKISPSAQPNDSSIFAVIKEVKTMENKPKNVIIAVYITRKV